MRSGEDLCHRSFFLDVSSTLLRFSLFLNAKKSDLGALFLYSRLVFLSVRRSSLRGIIPVKSSQYIYTARLDSARLISL